MRFFIIGISYFSGILFLLPFCLILRRLYGKHSCLSLTNLQLLFSFYISTVFSVAGVPGLKEMRPDFTHNLIPFHDLAADPTGWLNTSALNIILLIPFGFMLPLIWQEMRSFWKTALAGLILSALIETAQLFCLRLTDVDDLIMNTVGSAIGFLIYRICCAAQSRLPVFQTLSHSATTAADTQKDCHLQLPFIILLVLMVTVFISPGIKNLLFHCLYHT